ncbi:putative TetR family regulatory protein [Planotetraspora thailandica]|uniref:Putative TetR family regulatory protein n=1 Tax=Planotetraspora thailandica TaxID=487172 RepID=A0A8J3V541_9ACTN|nr:TetR family transcriptional regulator [Planotetraspora thailandica]GII57969.1 putative TetR family regulatory protein [Planotetraspora thailandica]
MAVTSEAKKGRPRDAAATRELLLAAGTEEFSEYGFAGARIDRISQRADTNKRMIYVYFGDKDKFFGAVLERQIAALAEAVPLTPEDLGAFAVARFDYMLANPQTRRLAAWRTFERADPTAAERASYQVKVDAVAAAQRAGKVSDRIPALDLFAMVLRLTESWLSAPPGLHAAAGDDPLAGERLAEHRAALAEAVRRITDPS